MSTVAREIAEAGGQAMAIAVDVRNHEAVKQMVDHVVEVGTIITIGLSPKVLIPQ